MKVRTKLPDNLVKELGFNGKGIVFDVSPRDGINITDITNGQPAQVGPDMVEIPYQLRAQADLSKFGQDGSVNLLEDVAVDNDSWQEVFQTAYDQSKSSFELVATGTDFGTSSDYPKGYDQDSVDFGDSVYEYANDQLEFNHGIVDFSVDFKVLVSVNYVNNEPQFVVNMFEISRQNTGLNTTIYQDHLRSAKINAEGSIDDVSVDYNSFTEEEIDRSRVDPTAVEPPYHDVNVDGGTDENATFTINRDLTYQELIEDTDNSRAVAAQLKQNILANIDQLFKSTKPQLVR